MAARKKRPPRQVWFAIFAQESGVGGAMFPFKTRREATDYLNGPRKVPGVVVGPYVLAERVRER